MSTPVRLVLFLLLAAAVAGMAFLVVRARRPPATTPPRPALTVTVALPEPALWPRDLPANGTLVPWQEGIIAAETGGLRIAEVLVDVGAVVTRGQELARLADDSVTADVAVAAAQLAQGEATAAEARANADRGRQGKRDGTLSEQLIAQYLAAEARATAELAAAKARLANQELRLAQTRVRAVDDGIISVRQVALGAVVQPGSELFRLIRQGRIVWRAEVDAADAGAVRVGQVATVNLPDGRTCQGSVDLIEPAADPATRLLRVRVALPADSGARAGWYAHGLIVLGDAPALHVPEASVVLRDGRSFVFTCRDDQVEQRPVVTGRRRQGRVEITTGLTAGELVVGSGGAFLNDHDRVRVQP
jgi:HlyD family secretion protein